MCAIKIYSKVVTPTFDKKLLYTHPYAKEKEYLNFSEILKQK